MTTNNFCFYLQNRLIQTSPTGGQWYSDTSPFSIPCSILLKTLVTWCDDELFDTENHQCRGSVNQRPIANAMATGQHKKMPQFKGTHVPNYG